MALCLSYEFPRLWTFFNRIMPVCETYNIDMAIHPDDPAWNVFGLPRIITDKEHLLRLILSLYFIGRKGTGGIL
jgi:D-mannonate dehydratase